MSGQICFGKVGLQMWRLDHHLAYRLYDIPAPTIVSCHSKKQAAITRRQYFSLADAVNNAAIQFANISYYSEANTIFMQLAHFSLKCYEKKLHQEFYFILRSAPVLTAKSKNSQIFYFTLNTGSNTRAYRF